MVEPGSRGPFSTTGERAAPPGRPLPGSRSTMTAPAVRMTSGHCRGNARL